jgi:hypothetical protein
VELRGGTPVKPRTHKRPCDSNEDTKAPQESLTATSVLSFSWQQNYSPFHRAPLNKDAPTIFNSGLPPKR